MRLSVIIVNYNVKYFLEQSLYAVRKASRSIPHEIFVVDNNSVDSSCEMVREKFPEVQLIENKQNVGFSKANNQAIRFAKGEYVLLLNPDTVVQEDTFEKIVSFMDAHPDAGGLGVKMIDGKGNFLPESKRGLPTPLVAFFKIFGLAALFPKSRLFGKYHLGYLDKDKMHEVDVLSGAFMLLRRKALDKAGLLDEDFFMYGEDIDLSYRIQKAGYKNFYFPDTRIIHYKGESTKKSSVNYVFVFYNAMIIFARKHFSRSNARLFSFLIKVAIYLRAGVAIVSRLFNKLALPLTDAAFLYGGMYLLKIYWENNHKYVREPYGIQFMTVAVPVYIFIWLFSVFLAGGYDRPVRLSRIIRGLFIGTLAIATMYAFLNESWRFSRALIILGAFWSVIATVGIRLFLNFVRFKSFAIDSVQNGKNVVIVAKEEEGNRVLDLIKQVQVNMNFIGFIHPDKVYRNTDESYLGNIVQIKEILEVYAVNEVIFSTKDMSLQEIIDWMSKVNNASVDYKIAPEESLFIIGSNSVDNPGDLYTIGINLSITKPRNKRNKRLMDILISLFLLLTFPLHFLIVRRPFIFIRNVVRVLLGVRTWVGYVNNNINIKNLPVIKKGVLSPVDVLFHNHIDESTAKRLNMLYAKHYQVENDLRIIWKGYRNLGRKR